MVAIHFLGLFYNGLHLKKPSFGRTYWKNAFWKSSSGGIFMCGLANLTCTAYYAANKFTAFYVTSIKTTCLLIPLFIFFKVIILNFRWNRIKFSVETVVRHTFYGFTSTWRHWKMHSRKYAFRGDLFWYPKEIFSFINNNQY